jgi:hypothetical protein
MAVLVVLLLVDAVVVAWNTAKNRVVYWPTRILRGTTLVFVDILCACRARRAPCTTQHLGNGAAAQSFPSWSCSASSCAATQASVSARPAQGTSRVTSALTRGLRSLPLRNARSQ